jgi:hypothetical protein
MRVWKVNHWNQKQLIERWKLLGDIFKVGFPGVTARGTLVLSETEVFA